MKVACEREGEKISQKLDQNKLKDRTEFVYRVFYSPKLNSCVAAQYEWNLNTNALSLRIVDALNQKEVWSASYHQNLDGRELSIYPDAHTELERQIKVLGLE